MSSLVVSFRWTSLPVPEVAVQAAAEIVRSAAKIDGALVAMGGFELAFSFALTRSRDAAKFAADVVRNSKHFARAGIAQGTLAPFSLSPSVHLAWGPPVVVAAALARAAQVGEVLVDAAVGALSTGEIRARGPGKDLALGGVTHATVSLDVERPAGPEPAKSDPDAEHEEAAKFDRPSASAQLLDLARDVIARSEGTSLEMAVAELDLSDAHAETVERLAGVLALTRGAKEQGLRVLRKAAEVSAGSRQRARAVLAYAIGVAAAGRSEDALLEALSALAIARASHDRSGEKACARFLSKLSLATGHPEAASAWEHVAQRASLPPRA